MFRIFHNTTFDFIRWWRWSAGLTIGFLLLGLSSFAFRGGVRYSIEFTGGTLMQLQFAQPPDVGNLRATLDAAGFAGAEIQQFGTDREFTVRLQDERDVAEQAAGAEGISNRVSATLEQEYGADNFTVVRSEAVGPRVGAELRRNTMIAIALGSLITLIYLAIRFEWRFGLAAVLSTLHDVLITIAFIKLMHIEVSLTIVAAILTLLGYSGNDTIIIFDRVRENLRKDRRSSYYDILNTAINETLPRSVMTHVTTLAATLALLFFAGEVIRPFALVMTFGIFVATFSSTFVASPLLLWIEARWPRKAEDRSKIHTRPGRADAADAAPPQRAARTVKAKG